MYLQLGTSQCSYFCTIRELRAKYRTVNYEASLLNEQYSERIFMLKKRMQSPSCRYNSSYPVEINSAWRVSDLLQLN